MTQSSGGHPLSPAGPSVAPSTDFGATTMSGRGWGAQKPEAAASAPTTDLPYTGPAPVGQPAGAGQPGASGASQPGSPQSGGRGPAAPRGRTRGPRRARLQLRHINPWTVLKFSCVLSIALFFVWLIVIGVLYGVLDAAGVINKINDTVTTINGAGSKEPVTAGIVFGGAAIVGVINIVLFIALSTIGSVIYNLCADLVGGVELTLSES
jgi:hypothetical protein